jgi:hypothetical protein
MNWIVGEVHNTDVVTEDDACLVHDDKELAKKVLQPATLGSNICNTWVLSFGGGARDDGLPLGRPRNKSFSEVERHVFGKPTQSTSVQAIRVVDDEVRSRTPWLVVPQTYLITHLMMFQWTS